MSVVEQFIKENPICVIGCIENFQTKKGEIYLDLWFAMEQHFKEMHIPVLLLSQDNQIVCDRLQMFFSTDFVFHRDDDQFFEQYNVLKRKLVFGQEKRVVYPYIFVFQEGELLKIFQRTNEKNIGKAYILAIDYKYNEFLKKIKNMFDIR